MKQMRKEISVLENRSISNEKGKAKI
jgi:hypothetical protein